MLVNSPALPQGYAARSPEPEDLDALVELEAAYQRFAHGSASVDRRAVASSATGTGSWTRRQLVVADPSGRLVARAAIHDRAAGRVVVELVVAPDEPSADALAGALLDWLAHEGVALAAERGLPSTQLDASAYADDARQQRWLTSDGYRLVRTWLQMSRPITAEDGAPEAFAPPREGVTIRRVATHEDGSPVAADLQAVHRVLEESFADHFNSYRESFAEFVQRLREDPGHRWDHWWLAEVDVDGQTVPGGALVGSVLPPDADGVPGSYIDYIGVHRNARGRGVAKALLHTVIRDAAERGRNRLGLEVDADSPTGADGLYTSMGWVTTYRTQSWHRDCATG
ncbi:GNAT family N-acetyltransferase [Calidifontibacter sp. DB0510]|uniref:GNAT family N-acetyltransferase n=1 Tax=Metallococcus carri TaxID=1656884 RepID=A0A967EGV4_9MICO|nr:GNAT family N-acetyltransferase [Metallococcus carri]NHN55563.1 GNAT family N-acetyltransferase [Metallococcus carri]NOP38253.1 GNAT family N-acetyltransferase [Calidifontibacter sp. DB2511S]